MQSSRPSLSNQCDELQMQARCPHVEWHVYERIPAFSHILVTGLYYVSFVTITDSWFRFLRRWVCSNQYGRSGRSTRTTPRCYSRGLPGLPWVDLLAAVGAAKAAAIQRLITVAG